MEHSWMPLILGLFFFFNDTATTEIYTLSLHDALPISHLSVPARFSATLVCRATRPWSPAKACRKWEGWGFAATETEPKDEARLGSRGGRRGFTNRLLQISQIAFQPVHFMPLGAYPLLIVVDVLL